MTQDKSKIRKSIILWASFSVLYVLLAVLSFQSRDAWSFSTTVWYPSSLLFATLWLTQRQNWPVWIATAGVLHILVGLYIGRPLFLSTLLSIIDILVFPFCVLAFRQGWQLLEGIFGRGALHTELIYVSIIALCNFIGSAFLNLSLYLAGYAVDPMHISSWALASLTGILCVLPLLHEENKMLEIHSTKKREVARLLLLLFNVIMISVLIVSPIGYSLLGLNALLLQLAILLVSVFSLTQRQIGLLLLIHYFIVLVATSEKVGFFYDQTSAILSAIWNAQLYLTISAVLTGCLNRIHMENRYLYREKHDIDSLISHLSQAGTWLVFHMDIADKNITWRGSPAVFFNGETISVSTLYLLESHCESSFVADINIWYERNENILFQENIIIHRLNGERLHCLLLMQRTADDKQLNGGISIIHS